MENKLFDDVINISVQKGIVAGLQAALTALRRLPVNEAIRLIQDEIKKQDLQLSQAEKE